MNRLIRLYRLSRALRAIWAWRPPRGVDVYVRVDPAAGRLGVLLDGPATYLHAEGPWEEMTAAEARARLADLAHVLADQGKLLDSIPVAPVNSAQWTFEATLDELRRRGLLLPMEPKTKGGA